MIPFARVALITTAGLHLDDQPPFDRETPSGDYTFRRIRADDDPMRLRTSWDCPASQDINCAFPLALLRELCGVAETHYSFSGATPEPALLLQDAVPQLLRELDADAVVIAPS